MWGWVAKTALGFIPNIIGGVKDHLAKKQELRKLETASILRVKEAEVEAKIRRIESADRVDSELDSESIKRAGWMDDYLLVITTIPMVVMMASPFLDLYMLGQMVEQVPGEITGYTRGMLTAGIKEGLTALSEAPDFYQYALGAVYVHALGMRRMVRLMLDRFANKIPTVKGK